MILRSRITKQESNVIEQKACSRSCGSSINLMRTSEISTAVLLLGGGFLRPALGNPHASDARPPETASQRPRLPGTFTEPEIRGSAAAQLVTQHRQARKQ